MPVVVVDFLMGLCQWWYGYGSGMIAVVVVVVGAYNPLDVYLYYKLRN